MLAEGRVQGVSEQHNLKEKSMPGIEGKAIAITGAGSGIGEATAILLAERGATVVLGDLRSDSAKKSRRESRPWAVKLPSRKRT